MPGGGQRDRGVLAAGAAAEILAADDDLVGRDELVVAGGWNGTWPLGSPACVGGTPERAYLPNILYSAGIDGLYVRYWAGMIWSVSTLSPRTYATPSMRVCITFPSNPRISVPAINLLPRAAGGNPGEGLPERKSHAKVFCSERLVRWPPHAVLRPSRVVRRQPQDSFSRGWGPAYSFTSGADSGET